MSRTPQVRHARQSDIPAITDIYNHYIEKTHITFHVEPVTSDERREWFTRFSQTGRNQLLVVESDGLLGFAHAMPFNPRKAYETSVETTIYLASGNEGRGLGTVLYSALFERLENEDVHRAYALIALPNAASIALHARLDFVKVSHLHEVGRKFDRFYDVIWMEKCL